jgi:CRP-like cAMP-binding protein
MLLEKGIKIFADFLSNRLVFNTKEYELGSSHFSLIEVPKGRLFAQEGRHCEQFAFIVEGTMRAFFNGDQGEVTTCICGVNSVASSTADLIQGLPSSISIEALEDSTLLAMPYAELRSLYAKYPFWANVGRVISETEYLSAQCSARCYDQQDALKKYLSLLEDHPDIILHVPLQHIASYLGMRPETLSRIRKKIAKGIS